MICVVLKPLEEGKILIVGADIIRPPQGYAEHNTIRSLRSRLSARSVLLPPAEVSTGDPHPTLIPYSFLLLTCFFFLLLRRIFTPPENPEFINHKFRYHISGHRSGQRNVFYPINIGKSLCNIIAHHC